MIKHHGQNQLGEEWVYFIFHFQVIVCHREIQNRESRRLGTWRQELKHKPWRNIFYWLAPHVLLSLLSYITQDLLWINGTCPMWWGLPNRSLIKKNPHRLAHSPTWKVHFLSEVLSSQMAVASVKFTNSYQDTSLIAIPSPILVCAS